MKPDSYYGHYENITLTGRQVQVINAALELLKNTYKDAGHPIKAKRVFDIESAFWSQTHGKAFQEAFKRIGF